MGEITHSYLKPKEECKLPKSTTEIQSLYWAQTSDEPLTEESKRKKEEKNPWPKVREKASMIVAIPEARKSVWVPSFIPQRTSPRTIDKKEHPSRTRKS